MVYRSFFRAILQRIPAEIAHSLAVAVARIVTSIPGVRTALRRRLQLGDPALEVTALGRTFPSPLGVAGGLDKGATWFESLGALGFGFVEVGTVTAHAQAGNEGKRVWRLSADRALRNRMGFPNPGAAAVAARLRKRRGETVVGVNIGKTKVVPVEDAGEDYRASARELAPLADFLVVNVSSPNTPGLREMQAVEPLRALIGDVQDELKAVGAQVPVLLKIGPDLSDQEVDAIADLAIELQLDGIVATNTTVAREGLVSDPALWSGEGGISGSPLKARSLRILERLNERVRGRLVLVSVGGIETADDVWQRLSAGATLVQAYTGFIYGGPLWASRINRELARRLRASECASLRELGSAAGGDQVSRGVMR
jgi:dihydroorotate dehydrogenase